MRTCSHTNRMVRYRHYIPAQQSWRAPSQQPPTAQHAPACRRHDITRRSSERRVTDYIADADHRTEELCVRACVQACNRMGLVCVPLYDTLGENAIEYIIDHSEASFIVIAAPKLPAFSKALPKITSALKGIVYWGKEPSQEALTAVQATGMNLQSLREFLVLRWFKSRPFISCCSLAAGPLPLQITVSGPSSRYLSAQGATCRGAHCTSQDCNGSQHTEPPATYASTHEGVAQGAALHLQASR